MGILNKRSLPDDKDDASEWRGTDDDQVWYMRWRLYVKEWFAFPCTGEQGIDLTFVFFPGLYILPATYWWTGWSWWYLFPFILVPVARRWRELPITLFAVFGAGKTRWENKDCSREAIGEDRFIVFRKHDIAASTGEKMFLSRQQLWCRWSFALLFPLLGQFHFYPRKEDVLEPGKHDDRDGKVRFVYRGWHKDELAYQGDGGFAGANWK